MKKLLTFFIIFFAFFLTSCGEDKKPLDTVAFQGEDPSFTSNLRLGSNQIESLDKVSKTVKIWDRQKEIINNICSGWSSDINNPIKVVSPEGHLMGHIEDSWEPNWSPDGEYIALACARDDDKNVWVVSNRDYVDSPEEFVDGWSREGQGSLSDRMEIYIVKKDATSLLQLTSNEAGDWLPKWFPANSASIESEFSKQVVDKTPLLIESNRDGNSEIYLLSTISTKSWRLTNSESQDQTPVWSNEGNFAVFASDRNGDFELFYSSDPSSTNVIETGIKGRPVNN